MAAATMLTAVQFRRRRIDWPAALTGVGLGALAFVAYLVDMRISDAITGVGGYGINPVEVATRKSADPWNGIWASLLRPFNGGWESAGVSVPLAALGMVLGLVVLRFLPSRKLLALGFFAGSAAAGVGMLLNEPGLVTGLLAACPLLVGGLVCLGKDDLRVPLVRRALIACGIAAVGIVATNYEVGGAAEWGGRFFHQMLPLLIPWLCSASTVRAPL
ncbi:MAG: hypothetical protein M5U19_14425 [Microthrixaceae bacterium]|nr:hypothetical protein [Microthrixaceae bacterium]